MPTWEEAQETFPHFAREDRLKNFLSLPLKGKGGVPQIFRDYCQAALDGSIQEAQPATTVKKNGHTAHFIESSFKTLTVQTLKKAIPNYGGVNLVLAHMNKVSTSNITFINVCNSKGMYLSRSCIG